LDVPDQPTVMLDNNALSHAGLARHVQGKTVYLPDVLFVELFGAGKWERSIPNCLGPLAAVAENVYSTVNLATALREELKTGNPVECILADLEPNQWLRRVLVACRDEPDRAVEYFRENQPLAVEERELRLGLVQGNRELSIDIISRLKKQVGEKALAQCRTAPEQVASYLDSLGIHRSAVEGLRPLPAGAGVECLAWDAERMASVPCCWMRLLFADLCLAVRRSVAAGFERASDEKLLGDYCDTEVVIMGSYADELLTHDRGAVWLDRALRGCIRGMFQVSRDLQIRR
jgi:hypothetical protein